MMMLTTYQITLAKTKLGYEGRLYEVNSSSPLEPLTSKDNDTQLFRSPFDFREPIKARERNSNRKTRKLERTII